MKGINHLSEVELSCFQVLSCCYKGRVIATTTASCSCWGKEVASFERNVIDVSSGIGLMTVPVSLMQVVLGVQ